MRETRKCVIWAMWFLGSFFYAYQYILRVLPSIMMKDLMVKFDVNAASFGQYSGLYYIGYAAMHIPLGIFLDRVGPKIVLPACVLLTSIGLLPLVYADNWIYPGIGRLLIGMGSSAAILGVFKIIRLFFREEKFTFILGCSVTCGLIGAIYGGMPIKYLMKHYEWDLIIHCMIGLSVILALAFFFISPKYEANESHQNWIASVRAVFSNPRVIMICLLAGCMVGPLEGFADVWGAEYLKVAYGANDALATSLPSLIFLGMCFGSPVLSFMAEKSKAYFSLIVLSALMMGVAFFFLLNGTYPLKLLPIVFFIVGVFCAYQILAIYKASTFVPDNLVALTTACANMIIMSFGYLFHSLIGKIMMFYSTQNIDFNYSTLAFTKALTIIPIGLLIGGLGFIILGLRQKQQIQA